MVVNIFCFHAFSTVKGLFFWGLLLYEIILEPEKNVLEKSLKTLGLYFQRLFIWATISENFFFKEFFWRLSMMVHIFPGVIWARSVQPFWRLSITKKQTEKRSIYIDVFIHLFLIGQPSGFLNVPLKRELREQEYLWSYCKVYPSQKMKL